MFTLRLLLESKCIPGIAPGTAQAEALEALRLREYEKAFALYERLAQAGSGSAMLWLAQMYFSGLGTDKSYEKARYWDERAYESSDLAVRYVAATRLQEVYLFGEGAPVDHEKAFRYVKEFESIERPSASLAFFVYRVALHYDRGEGTRQDASKAMELYRRAAAAGHLMSKVQYARWQILRGNLLALPSWLGAGIAMNVLEVFKRYLSDDMKERLRR